MDKPSSFQPGAGYSIQRADFYSTLRVGSGQAIEILHIMRRDFMIHQCSHRAGAGSREQSLNALVG